MRKKPNLKDQKAALQRLPVDLDAVENPTISIEEDSGLIDENTKEPIPIVDTLHSTGPDPLEELIQQERMSLLDDVLSKFKDQKLARCLEGAIVFDYDIVEIEHFYLFVLFTIIGSSEDWDDQLSIKDLKLICYLSGISLNQALTINPILLQAFTSRKVKRHPEWAGIGRSITELYAERSRPMSQVISV